jgi:hypothetical protein
MGTKSLPDASYSYIKNIMEGSIMKRPSDKKNKESFELHFPEPLQSVWLNEIRSALSPYWSSRAVIDIKKTNPGPEAQKQDDAA